jgi:hypothetical protein
MRFRSSIVVAAGEVGPADLADPNRTLFYFMPSAVLDKYGNLGMTYTLRKKLK